MRSSLVAPRCCEPSAVAATRSISRTCSSCSARSLCFRAVFGKAAPQAVYPVSYVIMLVLSVLLGHRGLTMVLGAGQSRLACVVRRARARRCSGGSEGSARDRSARMFLRGGACLERWPCRARKRRAARSGAQSTAEEVTAGIDLSGMTAVVTGCNSGIGFETMRVLALRGAHVIGTATNARERARGVRQGERSRDARGAGARRTSHPSSPAPIAFAHSRRASTC